MLYAARSQARCRFEFPIAANHDYPSSMNLSASALLPSLFFHFGQLSNTLRDRPASGHALMFMGQGRAQSSLTHFSSKSSYFSLTEMVIFINALPSLISDYFVL